MKQVVRGLLLSALAISSAGAKVYGDRTFLNHRDEGSDAALDFAGNNHFCAKANDNNLGATIMVSPFYSKTNNNEDIAKWFGQGTTGKITVAKSTTAKSGDFEGSDIDHSPTTDYQALTELPMYGTVSLKPERVAYGARLSWNQSLDSLLPGLCFHVNTPLVQANTNMNMSVSGTASASPANSGGAGKGLADFFGGSLTKTLGTTNKHVKQAALSKAKLSTKKQGKFSVGDVNVGFGWNFFNRKKFSANLGVNLVVPTGNSATGEWVFEPMVGNGGHTMLGASLGANFKAVCKKNLQVALKAVADWRYGFEATVKRTIGVGHNTGTVADSSSHYTMGMEHKVSGVFPLANVLTKDCNVTLGHQVDAVVALAGTFRGIKFDLGYNLFAREAEKVELKDKQWTDDKYAYADRLYSMSSDALGTTFLGGVPTGVTMDGTYNDTTTPVAKHQHVIGANG
ncbi:MAG: hypothetical protein PVJ92_01240, partial [Candidatus Dependentiae bacterium]